VQTFHDFAIQHRHFGNSKATITKAKPGQARAAASSRRTAPIRPTVPSPLSTPSRHVSEAPSGGELLDHATFSGESIERMVREVLATRDDTTRGMGPPPALPILGSTASLAGDIPALFANPLSAASSPFAQHILSRWPWVPEDTVKNIALGKFEIDTLPKLHRSDELRNAYLKRSMKGIYQPLNGGPPEIVVGTTKLHASIRDPTTFFLAWLIYMSICAEFKPEMGTRLAAWTETLHYFVKLNYPWPSILEYIIAYFQLY
jgi:hypothetical protein